MRYDALALCRRWAHLLPERQEYKVSRILQRVNRILQRVNQVHSSTKYMEIPFGMCITLLSEES